MRAIVQQGYGSADVLELREIALPAVADDGVLVRVHAASVNALDSHLVYMPLPARVFFGLPRPRVAVRGVDIVSLTGSGFCFGIAFAFLVLMLRGRIGPAEDRTARS